MTERTRTVSWEDPEPGAEVAREMSGLEYLRAMLREELPGPPIARLVGFGFVEAEEGRVVFECDPAEYHYNPIGSVHGASPARSSTRLWAARSTPSYRPASGTRRSS